jgi:hypothetical protein
VPLAIAHYKSALDIRPSWEKARKALEAAQAQQTAQEVPAEKPPEPDLPPVSNLDPDRLLDPQFHAKLLTALHDLVVKTDEESHQLLEFLQKEVEGAIRDLSICILTPNDPSHNLDEQLHRFNAVVTRIQVIHDALQERVGKIKLVGEQVLKI